ncbi:MAG: hypothetical protein Q7K40_05820 [bacterium]|nr:hypothetical protein [bacterium]
MGAQEWSIEEELLKLTNSRTVNEAISVLNLIPVGHDNITVKTYGDWKRGGAETYIFPFCIVSSSGFCRELILKAVVAYSPSRTLDDLLNDRLSRRHLLNDAGVFTPTLFFAGQGVILEQFVQHSLAEQLQKSEINNDKLIDQVFYYAGVLAKYKFSPTDAFSDLRTDGQNVFAIDFGEDLGPPSFANPISPQSLYGLAQDWVKKNNYGQEVVYNARPMAMFRLGYDDSTTN